MSRRLLSHERLGGLVPHPHPLLPLSCPSVPPSSPLAQDNYQPALLPKRVVRGRAIPRRAPGSQGPRAGPPWSTMQSRDTRERLAALQGLADAGVNHGSRGGQWEKELIQMMTVGWIFIWSRDITAGLGSQCYIEGWNNTFWSLLEIFLHVYAIGSHCLPPHLFSSQIGSCALSPTAPPPCAYR